MMWSSMGTPMSSAAPRRAVVTRRSARDGLGSPDGWKWQCSLRLRSRVLCHDLFGAMGQEALIPSRLGRREPEPINEQARSTLLSHGDEAPSSQCGDCHPVGTHELREEARAHGPAGEPAVVIDD